MYSVTLDRRKLISIFDAHGNKVSDTIETEPVSFRDLPFSTAQSYAREFPDANVKIAQEDFAPRPPSAEARRIASFKRANYARGKARAVPKEDSTIAAAARGDFAAAITEATND